MNILTATVTDSLQSITDDLQPECALHTYHSYSQYDKMMCRPNGIAPESRSLFKHCDRKFDTSK